jgi:hypothetical protein
VHLSCAWQENQEMAVPAPSTRCRSPFPFGGRLLLVLLALLAGRLPARADEEGVYYSNKLTFRIPFQVDPGDKRVSQVMLHVSEDLGRTYQQVAIANPGDKGFTFTARHDGWYHFTVQTMDQERKLYPPTVDGTTAGLRVFVDTVSPIVKLRPLPGLRPGEAGVEWDLQDESLDLNSIRLEYRAPGQFWQERTAQRAASGQARWDVTIQGPIDVRLQVKDRAGNVGEATSRLRLEGGRPMGAADEPHPNPLPDDRGPANVRKINSTRISLNYKIEDVGPSDVSTVEIWKTRDGRVWQRNAKDADKKGPFIVEVEGEGRYGITLIAKSGVGLGENAPRPGDEPQIWIEVDLTKPVVRIVDVIVGRGADSGNMTISWTASDKNLLHQPIAISYAIKPEGPWNPVPGASTLENTGRFVWRMQSDVPFEFFVRIEATDEAGNVGQATTQQTVKVDLSLPRARVLGVEAVKP